MMTDAIEDSWEIIGEQDEEQKNCDHFIVRSAVDDDDTYCILCQTKFKFIREKKYDRN